MENIVNESINKGIPVDTPILIRSRDLVEFANNSCQMENLIDKYFNKYLECIRDNVVYQADFEIFSTMQLVTDNDTLDKKIIFSPVGLYNSIYVNLNINNNNNNNTGLVEKGFHIKYKDYVDFLRKQIKDGVSLFGLVQNEEELKIKFPVIYKKYEKYMQEGQQIKRVSKDLKQIKKMSISYIKKLSAIKCINTYFEKNFPGKTKGEILSSVYSLPKFKTKYINFFNSLSNNLEKIIKFMNETPIDFSELDDIDKNKMELYMANQFMEFAEKDKIFSQKYIYYITNYFFEDKARISDENLKIKVGVQDNENIGIFFEEGHEITPKKIYERYTKLLIDNPEIKTVNFKKKDFSKMNLREVEEFMTEYIRDLNGNWELLPKSSYDKKEKDFLKSLAATSLGDEKEKINKNKQDDLLNLYMEKKNFYDTTDPFYRILGKNTFDGYIGYIYKNGTVVLDKLYENVNTKRLANGQAIYIMDIEDFYTLSNLSKNTLIKDKLCTRYIHKGDWQSRVLKEIDQPKKAEPGKELIKLSNNNMISGI